MCVFWKKKFIDVKISAWLPIFLTKLNLIAFPEKDLHSDFCLYIFEGLFFRKKKKRKEK